MILNQFELLQTDEAIKSYDQKVLTKSIETFGKKMYFYKFGGI